MTKCEIKFRKYQGGKINTQRHFFYNYTDSTIDKLLQYCVCLFVGTLQ